MTRPTLLLSLLLVACGGAGKTEAGGDDLRPTLAESYADIVVASMADSLTAAADLDAALGALRARPSEATLAAARDVWLESREPYLQTEVYRFYDGPIDNPDDGPEGYINAWPLDEQHIDAVVGDPDAGIINGDEELNAALLLAANEAGGEKNIATGFHAIEFLLWGQDFDPAGPGARPYTDYLTDGSATAPNGDRRALYLTTASGLLVDHLDQVHRAWDGGAHGQAWGDDPNAALEDILTGMIVLSGFETGGERLQASLDSGDQEDEHSCFSDNTHRDMVQDVRGVQNVWRGSYTRSDGSVVSGVGVRAVVEAQDPDLAAALDAQIDESLALAEALQPPYDQEIAPGSPGNARVQALIVSLRAQEQLLFEVFDGFGLSVVIPE
jgi:putative iron-regulated protein